MNAPQLTPELQRTLLAAIRSGGYPHVAALACGVSAARWRQWQRWANAPRGQRRYKDFFLQVDQAHAQARLRAEIDALAADPRNWLKHGPGKEQTENPGWTGLARPASSLAPGALDPLASPELLQLLAALRTALAPFPDALAAVTDTLMAIPLATDPPRPRKQKQLTR